MPPDTTAPTAPATLTGAPVAAGRIDLAWSVGSDDTAVAGYNVYRDGVKVNAAPVDSLSYSDTGLVAGASHTYSITALDAAGNESAKSPTWSGAAASGALTTTYSYDTENRLSALQTGSTVLGSYAYDWPCPGLTDIQYRPNRPGRDVHHGGHGTAETTETVVPRRIQG